MQNNTRPPKLKLLAKNCRGNTKWQGKKTSGENICQWMWSDANRKKPQTDILITHIK